MFCRTILAALHFNFNAKRKSKMDTNNQPRLTVKYPKFKGGDATVRELKLKSNYGNAAIAKFQNNVCSFRL